MLMVHNSVFFVFQRVSGSQLLLMIGFHVKLLVNQRLLPVGRVMSSGSLSWRRHMPNCMALLRH